MFLFYSTVDQILKIVASLDVSLSFENCHFINLGSRSKPVPHIVTCVLSLIVLFMIGLSVSHLVSKEVKNAKFFLISVSPCCNRK